jgi:hypothetical protein
MERCCQFDAPSEFLSAHLLGHFLGIAWMARNGVIDHARTVALLVETETAAREMLRARDAALGIEVAP